MLFPLGYSIASLEVQWISLRVQWLFPSEYSRFSLGDSNPFPSRYSVRSQRINLQSPLTCPFFVPPAVVRWVSSRPFHPEVAQATPGRRDSSDDSALVRGGFARIRKTACLRF